MISCPSCETIVTRDDAQLTALLTQEYQLELSKRIADIRHIYVAEYS